ncbi:MAG: chromosome segregation protein SMC [Verrucomicrobiota bacterium]
MYLKNLTVLGFKSFADKTTLNFQRGTTAIVGPNGCGKSNVSDAIRWVLGEQSAKALRGGEMADVIFNGTDNRKPIGMAEVSLTIGDVDTAHLKAAGVAVEFNEVTVTRRVFRDGGSEYFINKVGCRLRDIQQLFAGTGVGKTSYSVMAQGNITQILSSKPDDRRLVFEEAAGITLFKQQKREALRKLENTDQNLLRVEDLIKEVKRQIGSLQRQAGKARRYKALAQELQHLDTQLARHQFDVWSSEIAERTAATAQLTADMEAAQERVLRVEDEILQLRSALSELDHQISSEQQRGLELKAQSERHESRIHFHEERIRELESQNERALHDVAQADERRQIAEQELASVQQRLVESQAKVAEMRTALQEKQAALTTVERELSQHQETLRQAQSQAFSAAQQLSRARNEINQLDLQKQGNVVRLEKLHSEQASLSEESRRLEVHLGEFRNQVETGRLQAQTTRGTVEERQQRLRTLQPEIQQAQAALDAALRQQAETRSRLHLLEQLDTQHEGFGEGTLAVLKQARNVLGSLADRIRVPAAHVTAVESALGLHLQLVLTEQPESAAEILADLNSNRRGRASIAALAFRGPDSDPGATANLPLPAGTQPLLPLIECDDAVRPLVAALLGRTLLVSDLAAATAAYREGAGQFDLVTTTGDLLTRHGVFTGGSAAGSGKAPASILGRKNQIAGTPGIPGPAFRTGRRGEAARRAPCNRNKPPSRPASRRPGPNFAPPRSRSPPARVNSGRWKTPGAPSPKNSRTSPTNSKRSPPMRRRASNAARNSPIRLRIWKGSSRKPRPGLPPSDRIWNRCGSVGTPPMPPSAMHASRWPRRNRSSEDTAGSVLRSRPGSGNSPPWENGSARNSAPFRDAVPNSKPRLTNPDGKFSGSRMSDPRCPIRSPPCPSAGPLRRTR